MMQIATLSLSAMLLAGCAVTGPAKFADAGGGIPAGASVTVETAEENNPLETGLAAAVTSALRARGYQVADDGKYVLHYGIATRSSSVSLARENESSEIDWIARKRGRRILDKCDPEIMRINLVAYDLASANFAYRGTAEVTDCGFGTYDFTSIAVEFVERAAAGN